MIHSNDRKLCLSGWLQEHENGLYNSSLRLQKFLFFYEVFCKVDGLDYDFDRLKGYRNGPVFSSVYGDYRNDRKDFDAASLNVFHEKGSLVQDKLSKKASFLLKALNDEDIIAVTHNYDMWKTQQTNIEAGIYQVPMLDKDFSDHDVQITKRLMQMFPEKMIDNSIIYSIRNRRYLFRREDYAKLTSEHLEDLAEVADNPDLENPVYVTFDWEGRLLLD